MSIVNFTSGINNIEHFSSLSEWAVNYIFTHKLTRENFNSHEAFVALSRREKDAIRYQMRKCTNSRRIKSALPKSLYQVKQSAGYYWIAKVVLGVWISCFLLIDIANVYLAKGVTPLMAWQSAILVELCILSASMSTRPDLKRVAYALFVYNVMIFGFMELDTALNRVKTVRIVQSQLDSKEERIQSLKAQLKEKATAASDNLARLGLSHKQGYITSGTISYERVSRRLNEDSDNIKNEVFNIDREIADLQKKTSSSIWIFTSAILYFLLRCILQFFSIRLMRKT